MITNTEKRTCAAHGEFTATQLHQGRWTACPACSRAEALAREELEVRQHRQQRVADLMERCGLVGRFAEARLENFNAPTQAHRNVLSAVTRFADDLPKNAGGGLILVGQPGVGKTHLGAALVRAAIEQHGIAARIVTVRGLVRRLRDCWRRNSCESESDVIEAYGTVGLLVLDEVGASLGGQAEQAQLLEVIDLRYQHRLPTVVLSNLNVPLLRAALGERSIDRLRENARLLALDWPSHRGSVGASSQGVEK